jgi:hypothetical protein
MSASSRTCLAHDMRNELAKEFLPVFMSSPKPLKEKVQVKARGQRKIKGEIGEKARI